MTPPGWMFPVAWTILYVLEGVALANILHARGARGRGLAIALFVAQFVLSLAWTPVFFGAQRVVPALPIIASMIVLAVAATLLLVRIRRPAAWLMGPYLATFRCARLRSLVYHPTQ